MGKIAVLGMGESLSLYDGGYEATIGVNDIFKYVKTDYLVCVDLPIRFNEERLKAINESTPKIFYSQLDEWAHRADFKKISLQPYYPNHICQLDIKTLPKSLCSPFIAAVIAYVHHGANEIHLFGVDMTNHPLLKPDSCVKIFTHFKNLKIALAMRDCKLIVHGDGILGKLN